MTEPLDVTEIDVPFHRAGGGVVSTPDEIARLLRAQLGGELLPADLRKEMLQAVDSDWAETDRYGLGIGEITSLMGRERSSCGAAWGHLGFSVGYTAIALSSEDGERQVVICANGIPSTVSASEAFGTPPACSRGTCTACEVQPGPDELNAALETERRPGGFTVLRLASR